MKACHVPRLVWPDRRRRRLCESSLGVGNSVGRLGLLFTLFVIPVILPFVFWDKVRQEKLIEETDMDWIIVRPAVLTNRPARGNYRHGADVGNYVLSNRIARADVADFMLKQLTDDAYLGQATAVSW
jgi:NAD(P)H-binding